MYELLKKINGHDDIVKLSIPELNQLAEEVREGLFNRLTKIGGHFGPNFGVVELTIALHYVFKSPIDKFVFDVSHQSYPHKMLTGRREGYINDECFKNDSGYTNPDESEHDIFNVGHTSTSISLATGLAKARDLLGEKENIIAIIGDGSLSGGEALEGLNVAGSEIKGNLIIIVNDNQQSISETHGGLYKSLKDLRDSNGESSNNIFKAFGLDYVYEANGNDIESLINLFNKVKDIDHPIVVHLTTIKGKGYRLAEINKEEWHWCGPFDRETGEPLYSYDGEDYTTIAKNFILNRAKEDKSVVVITPNMPGSFDLSIDDRVGLGDQFVDVGIAEEQAVAMASGVAKRGCHPIVLTNTTFMQRTYDQVSHDVCINNNNATFLLNYNHFNGLRDVTHLGIFGLSIFSNIPNLVVLAPTTKEELVSMLDYALTQNRHPIMILMPGGEVASRKISIPACEFEKYEINECGSEVAIIALGDFYPRGEKLSQELKNKLGITPTLINPRNATTLDKEVLNSLCDNHKLVITLEDGVLEGGFGPKVATFFSDKNIKVKNYGLEKKFYDRYDPNELIKSLKMDTASIVEYVKENI
ncbi:MAG: 1-deoxy-D-xylulose-5-phosphate synthase [Bacilli bacterium]|nr:1-deoxy-D-xylulose-5-phosphate synthase [Bacilli bacterium]